MATTIVRFHLGVCGVSDPLSSIVPGPRGDLVATTLYIEQDTVDWLDRVADRTNRSRSEVAREILRAVREREPTPAVTEPQVERRHSSDRRGG